MKQLIMNVLKDMSKGQVNLESKATHESIANSIIAAIKTNNGGKGWFLDLSTLDGKPKLTEEETEETKWVCDICGKTTFHIDYEYIGSNYNHLGCELEQEMSRK